MTLQPERSALTRGAVELGVQLSGREQDLLLEYLALLYRWRASAGLTTVARDDAVRLHLLDSLSVLPDLSGTRTLADLGSGGGLPGLPIAICATSTKVTLVESRRRRCTFLTEAIRQLGLQNCEVIEGDAMRLASSGKRYDAVTARGFVPPLRLIRLGSTLVAPEGKIIIMAGPSLPRAAELITSAHHDMRCVRDRAFRLPGGNEQRRVVVLASIVHAG
jgi:16S rRNA (guanine527-N7)-methyltransferase